MHYLFKPNATANLQNLKTACGGRRSQASFWYDRKKLGLFVHEQIFIITVPYGLLIKIFG